MSLMRIKANGINFAVELSGPEDGPVVMMAHAMGTSMRIWDQQLPALTDRYRVLRYDWRGHGDTDAPAGPYTLMQFNDDAVAVMDTIGIDAVHWVGISTGGMIGQGLGIHHADRIRSLTLCNTVSQADAGYRDWVAARQRTLREHGMDHIWKMTERLWFTDSFVEQKTHAYRMVRDVFVRTNVTGYIAATSAVAELAWRDSLHRISAPTHIIAAGDDPVTPPVPRSTEIRERIPGATMSTINGQRHFSNVEVPQTFNLLLRRALDAVT